MTSRAAPNAARDVPWRATRGTLKRDVEVFLRGYVRRDDVQHEDAAEPLLAELGLVRETKIGGWYEFARGPKPSLPASVFAYALDAYWKAQGCPGVLTVEQLCYAPGSPGQVFKLDEDSAITRLMAMVTAFAQAFPETHGNWSVIAVTGSRSGLRETIVAAAAVSLDWDEAQTTAAAANDAALIDLLEWFGPRACRRVSRRLGRP